MSCGLCPGAAVVRGGCGRVGKASGVVPAAACCCLLLSDVRHLDSLFVFVLVVRALACRMSDNSGRRIELGSPGGRYFMYGCRRFTRAFAGRGFPNRVSGGPARRAELCAFCAQSRCAVACSGYEWRRSGAAVWLLAVSSECVGRGQKEGVSVALRRWDWRRRSRSLRWC